jgi:flagellar biosynthesis GTPase FlhF
MLTLTSEQKRLFEQLSIDREQNAKVLEKRSMRGIKLRVIEKYSESAHFIYELLQNADDAKATRVRFLLNHSGLIFAHNGTIHFSLTDPASEESDTHHQQLGHINAITSIGNSNKYAAQIGKFGVGFKAIFQYTNTPEIYDPPFCFKIERFIVPILLNHDHPERAVDETLFYFPFDNPEHPPQKAFIAIVEKLKHLRNPLLFLRYLDEMTWFAENQAQGCYTKKIMASWLENKMQKIMTQHLLNQKAVTTDFLVFSRPLKSLSEQKAVYLVKIAYLMQTGFPPISYQQTFPAYCFFATKESTGLRFIVQAPFLLTDNREGLKQDEPWNQKLIEAIAQLTAETLPLIKAKDWLTDAFFNVLPIHEADFPNAHPFRIVYDKVLETLQSDQALLPTQENKGVNRQQAYLAENPDVLNLFNSAQLSELMNQPHAHWVFPKTTAHHKILWEYVKTHLVNQEVTQDKILKRITKTFIQNQTDRWLMQFYSYLLDKPRYLKHKKEILRTKPILRLCDQQIVSAYNRAGKIQVYLPIENQSDYPTVKPCFVKHEKSKQFLHALGLEKPQEYEEIQYYILPRYQKNEDIEPGLMLRDFRKLVRYFLNCPWQKKTEYVNQLKTLPFCRAVFQKNKVRVLPTLIYFNTTVLKQYFSDEQEIYFLDNTFYQACRDEFTQDTLNTFFKELGIENKPRRIKIQANLSWQDREAIHQGQCTYDYYHFSRYTYDYDLEGLNAFLKHQSLENSKILWQFLLKLIEAHLGEEIFKGQYHWFYRREQYHYFEAQFLITLRETAWLYKPNGFCVKPAEIILSELAMHYETESYAASILIEKLKIQSETFSDLNEAQNYHYALGNELFKLAAASGIEAATVFRKMKQFLTQTEKKTIVRKAEIKENESNDQAIELFNEDSLPSLKIDTLKRKRTQLENQLAQQIQELTDIEALQSRLFETKRYDFEWFNTLLELEYLLNYENKNLGKKMRLQFAQVQKDGASEKIIILKNPTRYIPQLIEDIADLSLQLHFGSETKQVLIEVVNVKAFTLHARLKSISEIESLELNQVEQAIIEIKNPTFILEKLKAAFRQLPCHDEKNLQHHLPKNIEFIFGPPGTGKTTYLAKQKVLPLLNEGKKKKILVLTPTNKVADVFVKKMMAEIAYHPLYQSLQNQLIRFGVTGENEIDNAGLLKDKTFDMSDLTRCVLVTTIARFLYDGFSNCLLKAYHWDVIVFDEASMIMLAEIIYVLYQQNSSCHFIVSGDPFQIQPIVIAEAWKTENIYTLVGLQDFGSPETVPHDFPITQLTTQYRSIPPLGELVSQFSYEGILKHQRQLTTQKRLKIEGLHLSAITVIKFPVNVYDRLYKSQRLEGSGPYHIYSAIFTVELAHYLFEQIKKNQQDSWKIGIVCPYVAQATLVEKIMRAQQTMSQPQVQITTGTVHSFQGDEFDLILSLLNPPPQISPNIFLNNHNILNVAISRAKDYLILIMPEEEIEALKKLERLLKRDEIHSHVQEYTSAEIEQILFNQSNYITDNSFISTHQKINVYGKAEKKYEIRCEENAVDIQLQIPTA